MEKIFKIFSIYICAILWYIFIENKGKVKRGLKMKKTKSTQKIHIAIIILGTIFVALSCFHANIWFDEAYTVGMVQKSFVEIWNIGGHDVHPILYYWLLRIVSLVVEAWGLTTIAGKIVVYRIFSVIPIAILGILGYTHIRKDFGEKVGILFTFLTFFLPQSAVYANEIRMYSWAILSVTILGIYAYRLRLPENSNRKNWLIFFIASLFSIYIHYYGLMAAGLINVFLLIYLIKNKRAKDILTIMVSGVIQLIAYIPWLMYFIAQLSQVSGGFWIQLTFPDTLIEVLAAQTTGKLDWNLGFGVATLLYIYLGIKLFRYKGDKQPVKLSIGVYLAVILAALIMTQLLSTSILYYRYLFVITGFYIFTISFILSKEKNNKIIWIICAIIVVLATMNNIKMIEEAYGENNYKQYKYLQENIQEGDQIIYKEIGHGSTITIYFPEYQQYFYNPENWGVEEAYKALGENMKIVVDTAFLQELDGRIWIMDKADKSLYNELFNNEEYTLISENMIYTDYYGYAINMILVEKK